MSLAMPPPEEVLIVAEHNAAILRLQKQIVEAVQQRPYYTFRNLVFLCWRRTQLFRIGDLDNHELQALLGDILEGVVVPYYTTNMEREICNCFCRDFHKKRCAVYRFLAAIED